MNTLALLQGHFFNYVFSSNADSGQLLTEQLEQGEHLSTREQINIYKQSIQDGFINALMQIYPVSKKLVGDRFFYDMAKQYFLQSHSMSADLADYGATFPAFIADFKAAKSLPYLSDISKLEWAYHRAFHAQDEMDLDIESIYKYSAEQLSESEFSLPVSHHFIQSQYPIDKIWEMHQSNQIKHLNIEPANNYFFIFRRAYSIHIDQLSEYEYQFLNTIKKQKSFLEVYDLLADTMDASALLVHSLLKGWINKLQN